MIHSFRLAPRTLLCLGILLSILGRAFRVEAQAWQWAVKTGQPTGGEARPAVTALDPMSRPFVAGAFVGSVAFGATTLTSTDGSADVFLARYSPTGQPEWAVQLGGIGNDAAQALAADRFGNVYLGMTFDSDTLTVGAATFYNQGTSGGVSAESTDALLVKIGPMGQVLWARQLGTPDTDGMGGLATDYQGDVYAAGQRQLNFSFGFPADSLGDTFVARYDAAGNQLWLTRGGSYDAMIGGAYALTTSSLGQVLVTGLFTDSARFGLTQLVAANEIGIGDDDAFVAALDGTTGQWQWAQRAGGIFSDIGTAIAADPQGNVIVAGAYNSPAITVGADTLWNADSSLLYHNAFVAKLSPTGQWLWSQRAGGAADVWPTALTPSFSGGDVYLTGAFSDNLMLGTTTLTAAVPGEYSGYLARFDNATGTPWWVIPVDGHSAEDPISPLPALSRNGMGDLFLAGAFTTQATFGATTLTASGAGEGFLARFQDMLPLLTTLAPTSGVVGTTVTLTGARLGAATQVLFNGVPATFTVVGPTQIRVTVPAGATTGVVSVTTPTGTVNSPVVFRVGAPTGLPASPASALALYPNPARSAVRLTLATPVAEATLIEVVDLLGRVVRAANREPRTATLDLDVAGLPAGRYVVRCGALVRPLVVE